VATATPISPTLPALSVQLDGETIDALASAVAARVAELIPEATDDVWLDSRGMADYLGVPLSTIRTLTARGELPVYQDREGGNYYGKRSELDDWRRSNLPSR
jgi:excisionase family DNA binding protein